MKKIFLLLIILGLICEMRAASFVELRSSIEQYGITWTFDKEYETGKFVNGDWWVVGPVVVTAVTPKTAVCTADIRGVEPSGYIWWSGEYWCISSLSGIEGAYHWRRYDENPEGIYGWWAVSYTHLTLPTKRIV